MESAAEAWARAGARTASEKKYSICSHLRIVESQSYRLPRSAIDKPTLFCDFSSFTPRVLDLYPTGVGFLLDPRRSEKEIRLIRGSNKDDRLRAWNLKAPPATIVSASQHIVDSDEVVARFFEASAVVFVRTAWRLRLSRAFQPANVVFSTLAAVRTAIRRLLYFFFLVEKIAFVHIAAP